MCPRSIVAVALVVVSSLAACAAPTAGDDVESSEDALTSLPAGRFAVERAPGSGSYVASLTLRANRTFEMEYVRVTESSSPWGWNPWISVPSRKEEKLALRGTYNAYDAHGPRVRFAADVPVVDRLDFGVAVTSARLTLTTDDGGSYVLRASSTPEPTDPDAPFVASCDGGGAWHATLRLDQASRRRGSFVVDRRASDLGASVPERGSFAVTYTRDTATGDGMRFEGAQGSGARVSFDVPRDVLSGARRSFEMAVISKNPGNDWGWHSVVACTVP